MVTITRQARDQSIAGSDGRHTSLQEHIRYGPISATNKGRVEPEGPTRDTEVFLEVDLATELQ